MPLFLEALGSLIRAGLMFGAGILVAHGIWTQAAADNYVNAAAAALALSVASLGWSLWQKYAAHIKLLTALSLPAGSSVDQVQAKIDAGKGATLGMILLAVALGAGGLTLTGCAGKVPPSTAPAALSAVKAAEVVHALDAARDIAKVVSDGYPTVITPKDFQTVLTAHQVIVTVIGAAPNGWKATAQAGLDQLAKDLSPSAAARLGPYLALVRTLVDAFVPAGAL